VKPWNFDPSKWIIWTLSNLGLTRDLRRVQAEQIRIAELETKALAAPNDPDQSNRAPYTQKVWHQANEALARSGRRAY